MGYTKGAKGLKAPSHVAEFAFVSVNLMFVKLYKEELFLAMSFFTVLLPAMVYLIGTLFTSLLKFIQLMHMEDIDDDSSFLTVKQRMILAKVIRNLLGYFGIYFLSQQLDLFIRVENIENINIAPAVIGIDLFLGIQMYLNWSKRKEIRSKL